MWEPSLAMHVVAYPQLCFVWPKRCQRLHCIGPFGSTYHSIDTRKPQISVSDLTLDTSGPRDTDIMNWCGRALVGGVRVVTAGKQLRDSLHTNIQGFKLLPDDALMRTNTEIFYQKSHTAILWECESVKTHTVLSIKGPQCTDLGSETVGG